MIRRLAVLLALLPSLAGAQIKYTAPPGVAEIASYTLGCIPKATSPTGLDCSLLSQSGGNITLASGQLLLPSGSTGAPALRLGSTVGLYNESNYAIGVPIGQGMISGPVSSSGVAWGGLYGGVSLGSAAILAWSSGNPNGTQDVKLYRDAANTLALRNGTAAQTFNIYNTYTDGSNYERLSIGTNATTAFIYASAAGSGTQRPLDLGANGSVQWRITTGGHWITLTDNAFDIGASGATRPRSIYLAANVTAAGTVRGQYHLITNGSGTDESYFQSQSPGIVALLPSSGTATTLQFGGTTSSFSALKRVGATMALVFADDTGPLTNATMTAENRGLLATTTSSYTWTNAMVVAALGGGTTGDITVATLPAKTQVIDAAVVITGAAAGPATLTVACGRTGATYIDYIVASDAKAAANTVYGDAIAERGTNLTGYDLPSYTGTTTVTCHFIAADTTAVTGSTGRVILTTRLLP